MKRPFGETGRSTGLPGGPVLVGTVRVRSIIILVFACALTDYCLDDDVSRRYLIFNFI